MLSSTLLAFDFLILFGGIDLPILENFNWLNRTLTSDGPAIRNLWIEGDGLSDMTMTALWILRISSFSNFILALIIAVFIQRIHILKYTCDLPGCKWNTETLLLMTFFHALLVFLQNVTLWVGLLPSIGAPGSHGSVFDVFGWIQYCIDNEITGPAVDLIVYSPILNSILFIMACYYIYKVPSWMKKSYAFADHWIYV